MHTGRQEQAMAYIISVSFLFISVEVGALRIISVIFQQKGNTTFNDA